jgi:hypothetical protein
MHGLQDPNQSNVYNLNKVKPSRGFKNNKKEYLQSKNEELETVSLVWRNQ